MSRKASFIAIVSLSVSLAVAPMAAARAADDIQQIKLGTYTLYLPKLWMRGMVITAFTRPDGMTYGPQTAPIETDNLSIRPQDDWKPYGKRELPELIRLSYGPGAGGGTPRGMLDALGVPKPQEVQAAKEDSDGFVGPPIDPAHPEKHRAMEIFVYQRQPNDMGQRFIVESHNAEYPNGRHSPSSVSIGVYPDLGLRYRFDNTVFPENTWWALYQRTLAFLEYMQKPK
jgi:hypothetical protein